MLTLITELAVFRVKKSTLQEATQLTLGMKSESFMPYVWAVELLAWLRDEPVSGELLKKAIGRLSCKARNLHTLTWNEGTEFSFLDMNNVTYTPQIRKETLARHFTLIEDFISDYPESNIMPLPTLTTQSISTFITAAFRYNKHISIAQVQYTMSLFNPKNPLLPFLFSLKSMSHAEVTSLVMTISTEDRIKLLTSHNLQAELKRDNLVLRLLNVLPERGEGLAILCTLRSGREYLASEEGIGLLSSSPSWLFCNAVGEREGNLARRYLLSGFEQEEEPIRLYDADTVYNCLMVYLETYAREEEVPLLCSMLGLRHSLLKNEDLLVYPPYQIVTERLLAESRGDMSKILTRIGIDTSLIDQLAEKKKVVEEHR